MLRHETIKILEENTSNNLFDSGYSNFFLDMSSEARETKVKINYWDYIKIKGFCTEKETIIQTKVSLQNRRRNLQMFCLIKGYYLTFIKNL